MQLSKERTLVLIKPDGVERGLIGEVVGRFERCGLRIVAMEMFLPTLEQVDGHYPKSEEWIARVGGKTLATYEKYGIDAKEQTGTYDPLEIGRGIRSWLISYMASGPMVKMIIEGLHSIDKVRKLAGHTVPMMAEPGTIRGDLSHDSPVLANIERRPLTNIIHASENIEEATHELQYWFGGQV